MLMNKFYAVGEFNIWVHDPSDDPKGFWIANDEELNNVSDRRQAGVFNLLEAINVLDVVYSMTLTAEVRIVPVKGGDA